MKTCFLFLLSVIFLIPIGQAQEAQTNILYIVDSTPVIETPKEGIELSPDAIADLQVIKNKDTLKILGYDKLDGVIFIFTKEYRNRSEALKQIPSTKQMERKNGIWYFRGNPYSGSFIDYYFDGKKEGEGLFSGGRIHGKRTTYHPNGHLSLERVYDSGIAHGSSKEFFEDGTLRQQGIFNHGKEEGVWEMYFPNGQVKQRSNFQNGKMEGETIVYYSTGKIKALEITKNGKTTPDKRFDKLDKQLDRGHENSSIGDYKAAIKSYSKAIELDSTYAEAYFARGTARLNDFQFDAALSDFDKALTYEPYFPEALSNRAFTRIRKHQIGSSRTLSNTNGVTILASKDNPGIPQSELTLICIDLKKAIFLGDKSKMTQQGVAEFCK